MYILLQYVFPGVVLGLTGNPNPAIAALYAFGLMTYKLMTGREEIASPAAKACAEATHLPPFLVSSVTTAFPVWFVSLAIYGATHLVGSVLLVAVCSLGPLYFATGGLLVLQDFSQTSVFKQPGYVRSNPLGGAVFGVVFWPWYVFVRELAWLAGRYEFVRRFFFWWL